MLLLGKKKKKKKKIKHDGYDTILKNNNKT